MRQNLNQSEINEMVEAMASADIQRSKPFMDDYLPEQEEPTDEIMEDDGQPSEYDEWQDYMGGDDWDHGQYDSCDW